jgi:hypothetical protein
VKDAEEGKKEERRSIAVIVSAVEALVGLMYLSNSVIAPATACE